MNPLPTPVAAIALNPKLTGAIFVASIAIFLLSLIAIPVMVARMPADYFTRPRVRGSHEGHWVMRLLARIAKNTLGGILVLLGLVMLVTPGQGVLSILVGIGLLEFPGKRALELRIVRAEPVRKSIAWIREKAGSEALMIPPSRETA